MHHVLLRRVSGWFCVVTGALLAGLPLAAAGGTVGENAEQLSIALLMVRPGVLVLLFGILVLRKKAKAKAILGSLFSVFVILCCRSVILAGPYLYTEVFAGVQVRDLIASGLFLLGAALFLILVAFANLSYRPVFHKYWYAPALLCAVSCGFLWRDLTALGLPVWLTGLPVLLFLVLGAGLAADVDDHKYSDWYYDSPYRQNRWFL